jgi:pimeloyl-ACP methyl ester carboxylesterase
VEGDVKSLIMIGCSNCNLFSGHSFGSVVALVYSAMFPDDVETYVSFDCVRALLIVQEEDLLQRTRYALDRALAVEKKLAFDPPSYTYKELRDMVYAGSLKSPSPESCDILLERGMKKLPADGR